MQIVLDSLIIMLVVGFAILLLLELVIWVAFEIPV